MSKKNKILVTGGAGFVGTNLIKFFLVKTNFKIISIDNYSSGKRFNHIRNSRIKYVRGDTKNIEKIIKQKEIHSVFHFGEFARLSKLFKYERYIESNTIGSNSVFNFC